MTANTVLTIGFNDSLVPALIADTMQKSLLTVSQPAGLCAAFQDKVYNKHIRYHFMPFRFPGDLEVDDVLRREFSRPFGKVMNEGQLRRSLARHRRIYAVGDATVSTLLGMGRKPWLSIFDYRTGRRRRAIRIIEDTYRSPVVVANPQGVLGKKLWNAVRKASAGRSPSGIRVVGEEDLGSLACIHFAKPGDTVMYGLRGKGIAVIRVDRKIKLYVESALARMPVKGI